MQIAHDRNRQHARSLLLGKILTAILLAGTICWLPPPAAGAPPPVSVMVVAKPLIASEIAYQAHDLTRSRLAALAALELEPESYEASWRLSRVIADLGHQAVETDEQRRHFEQAERYARRAVELNPRGAEGHLYVAIAVGRLALYHGGRTKIRLGEEVRDEARRAVELDPTNDLALHVLAQWHREVASLSGLLKMAAKVMYGGVPAGASMEMAVEYFERAIAIRPEHIHHRLELGVTLMSMGRYEEAAGELELVLELPTRDPNDAGYKREASELLREARKKLEQS
jgi:tetratricopeptide (TPR) repeat protein